MLNEPRVHQNYHGRIEHPTGISLDGTTYTIKNADEYQLFSAFTAFLDCEADHRCFDGRCNHCRQQATQTTAQPAPSTDQESLSNLSRDTVVMMADLPAQRGLDTSSQYSHKDEAYMSRDKSGNAQPPIMSHNLLRSLSRSPALVRRSADSSTSIGRASKFHEDMTWESPSSMKKKIKKRRSFHRLLRKCWRSAHIFTSNKRANDEMSQYDGPNEQPPRGGLSIPNVIQRRLSNISAVSGAGQYQMKLDQQVSDDFALHRRDLENYERHLTVEGDDRRHRLSMDHGNSGAALGNDDRSLFPELHRSLSRAAPLYGPNALGSGSSLMEKALQRHQQEKAALLRSRPLQTSDDHQPNLPLDVFNMSFGPASIPEQHTSHFDDIDPLTLTSSRQRSQSAVQFSSNDESIDMPIPVRPNSTLLNKYTFPPKKLAPPSWGRYPSYNRKQRCGSAGPDDGISSRDFAEGIQLIQNSDDKKRDIRGRFG